MLSDLNIEIIAIIALIIWNIVVFVMYGLDKQRAKLRKRRISEETLMLSALLLGGTGALFGMSVFRHKTKHLKFKIGVPLLLILNIIFIAVFIKIRYF